MEQVTALTKTAHLSRELLKILLFGFFFGAVTGFVVNFLSRVWVFPVPGPIMAVEEIILLGLNALSGHEVMLSNDATWPMLMTFSNAGAIWGIICAVLSGFALIILLRRVTSGIYALTAGIIILGNTTLYSLIWASSVLFDTVRITPYNYKSVALLAVWNLLAAVITGSIVIYLHRLFRRKRKSALLLIGIIISCFISGNIFASVQKSKFKSLRTQLVQEPLVAEAVDSRVLVLGIDGLEWDLVNRFIAEGKMPTFKNLISRGVACRLRTDIPYLSPVVWTSVSTGFTKARHGITGFFSPDGKLFDGTDVRKKPVWELLNEAGIESGIFNWFFSWPAKPLKGYCVTELFSYENLQCRTYPEKQFRGVPGSLDLEKEIADIIDFEYNPDYTDHSFESTEYQLNAFFRRCTDELKRDLLAIAAADSILSRPGGPPAFSAVYLKGTDTFSHLLWRYYSAWSKLAEKQDPEADQHEKTELFGPGIEAYYRLADRTLGRFLSYYTEGREPSIFVLSDHGFGPRSIGLRDFDFNKFFQELGWLHFAEKGGRIVWEKTKVFDYKLTPGFRNFRRKIALNLKERNSNGIVEAGASADSLLTSIIRVLDSVKTESGKRVFVDLERASSGLPYDLLVTVRLHLLNNRIDLNGSSYLLREFFTLNDISGMHRYDAFLLLNGPPFSENIHISRGGVRDIAPTIVHLFGLPVPIEMEGRVLLHAMKQEYVSTHPVRYSRDWILDSDRIGAAQLSGQVLQEEMEKLKSLGYVR